MGCEWALFQCREDTAMIYFNCDYLEADTRRFWKE